MTAARPSPARVVDPTDPLAPLGLHGLSAIALPVLAGLVTGDPVLLVGPHGTAKTALAATLARVLGLRFRAYDASKALFEDIVGFPDPAGLAEGRVDYVPTGISIWGTEFVLVDELSRASPAMQNKWLEVVRGRRVMGLSVEGLRHVFAAMNPPGYLGARPLDPALVGRFAFVVQVPGVERMSPAEVGAVIRTVGEDDAPCAAAAWRTTVGSPPTAGEDEDLPAPGGVDLAAVITTARDRLPAVVADLGDPLTVYVREVAARLRGDGVHLDGRRLALIWRGLCAALSVAETLGHAVRDPGPPPEALIHDILRHMLPGRALDAPEPAHAVYTAHSQAWTAAFATESDGATGPRAAPEGRQAVTRALAATDPVDVAEAWEAALPLLDEEEHHELASRVLRHLRPATRPGALQVAPERAVVALQRMLVVVEHHHAALPVDVSGRLLAAWQGIAGLRAGRWSELLTWLERAEPAPGELPHSATDWLASRIALELSREEPGNPDEGTDDDKAHALRPRLRSALRAGARHLDPQTSLFPTE